MLFRRQKTDWLVVAVVAVGLFMYASYQPRFRLRSDLPAEFLEGPTAGSLQKPSGEDKIASAYWRCLVENVQWEYGYGRSLPTEPPPDFTMAMSGGAAENNATRVAYWRRAQRIWSLPGVWQEEYHWDFHWTTSWLQNGGDWLHNRFQHLGGD